MLGSPGAYRQVDYPPTKGIPGSSQGIGGACSALVFWQPGRATWAAVAAAWRRGRGSLLLVLVASPPPPAASY